MPPYVDIGQLVKNDIVNIITSMIVNIIVNIIANTTILIHY
jgi:hypothetical protein